MEGKTGSHHKEDPEGQARGQGGELFFWVPVHSFAFLQDFLKDICSIPDEQGTSCHEDAAVLCRSISLWITHIIPEQVRTVDRAVLVGKFMDELPDKRPRLLCCYVVVGLCFPVFETDYHDCPRYCPADIAGP